MFSFVSKEFSASVFKVPELGSQNSPDPNHKYHHLSNIRYDSLKILVGTKKANAGMKLRLGKYKFYIGFLSLTF